jgi:NADPH2:quinone reductase
MARIRDAVPAGDSVIGTVRRASDVEMIDNQGDVAVVALDQPDPASAIRTIAGGGIDRIIEVAFSDNVDLDAAVAKNNTIIVAYATRQDRPVASASRATGRRHR